MSSVLPRGISHHKGVFLVRVKYQGHVAHAVEPSLFYAEIRKGQLLETLIHGRSATIPSPLPGVRPWTLENAYDRVSELFWKDRSGGKSTMLAARNALAYFGRSTLVENITSHMVDLWMQHMREKEWSPSTINKHISALSRMCRFAYSRGGATHIPIFIRVPNSPGRTRYLTTIEEAKIFNYLATHPARDGVAFIRTLLDTGMRVGELLDLTESDVDFERNLILIWKNKGKKPRAVPMTNKVKWILRGKATGASANKFFPRSYRYYRRTWSNIRTALGLEDDQSFVIHCLRHTCASRLIHHGVHILTVKEWMGHKSMAATLRYIHLAPKNLYDAVRVLETGNTPAPREVTWEGGEGGWRPSRRSW